jgi:O-antigen ligase
MGSSWLPWFVTITGVAAGWEAARCAGFTPLLWVAMLGAILLLSSGERRVLDGRWLFVGVGLLAVSWVVAADHELALGHSLLALAAVLLFGLSRRAAPGDRLVSVMALGLALTAVVAVGQALGGLAHARALVETLPPAWHEAATIRLTAGRVFGTSALPGHFAALLVLVAPLIVERAWRASRWTRAGWGVVLLLILVGTVLTRSLAAPLVGGLLLLPVLARQPRNRPVLVAAAAVVIVAVGVLVTRSDVRRLEPLRLRWINWHTTAWVFAHHPWLGVGLGGVGQAGLVAPTASANITPYAHNTYLQLLAEFGLAGAGVLAAGVWSLQRLVRHGFAAQPGLALAVAALPLHNLVDFSAYAPEILLPWAILAGTLASRTVPPPARPARGGVLLALAATGALLATLAWRGEVAMDAAVAASPAQAVGGGVAAAAWVPWAVTPLELAAGAALQTGAPGGTLAALDRRLAARAWVRPYSAGWAETRARLLLAEGRRGEAETWAREACRRAPWRTDLAALERACTRRP